MPIVSSTVSVDREQHDGRRKIVEHHTDHVGIVHERRYLAEPGQDVESGLAEMASVIEQQLAQAEQEANLAEVEGNG